MSIESEVGMLLGRRGLCLSTAESCTGGRVAARITAVAGSSGYYLGGVVAYSNSVKSRVLDVAENLLEQHGAVSAPVAEAMAVGVCGRLGADLAVSTTGIAGPGGGSIYKPVGLVYIGLAESTGFVTAQKFNFQGNREDVQMAASQAALEMIQRYLN